MDNTETNFEQTFHPLPAGETQSPADIVALFKTHPLVSAQAASKAEGNLPHVTISSAPGSEKHPGEKSGYTGSAAVAHELVAGAKEELTEHPWRVERIGVDGLVMGAVSFLLPNQLKLAAAAGGAAAFGYRLYTDGGTWLNSAKIVAEESGHTPNE